MAGRHVDPRSAGRDRARERNTIMLAILCGALLSGVVVLTTTRAAFSASTSNTDNQLSAGTVTLTDDDGGTTAMFDISDMAPDDAAVVRCIEVTYGGTITDPGEVRLYSGGLTESGTLADELELTVEIGTGSTTLTDCSNFTLAGTVVATTTLSAFDAASTGYSSGVTAWDPATTPETRTFRFTIDLPSDADNAVQGDQVTNLVFTWEVQS